MGFRGFLRDIWTIKPLTVTLFAFIAPLYLVIPIDKDALHGYIPEMPARCLYVILVMSILWITDALPIAVTSMLPVFLFPMFGIVDANTISAEYMKDTTMLFLGGLLVAIALEESKLHTRLSLAVLMIVGEQPILLLLGIMGTTWFLSMWINNTAATSMMIPIMQAVLGTIKDLQQRIEEDGVIHLESIPNNASKPTDSVHPITIDDEDHVISNTEDDVETAPMTFKAKPFMTDEEFIRLTKGFTLSIAYAANIGGTAVLTGTEPNLLFQRQVNELYIRYSKDPSIEPTIAFTKWMGFAVPLSFLVCLLGWLWLSFRFIGRGCFKKMDAEVKRKIGESIRMQFKGLGRITLWEVEVLIVFLLLIFAWLFRDPPNIAGWDSAFRKRYPSDSTPSILFGCLLFVLPAELPNVFWRSNDGPAVYKPALSWSAVQRKFPWGVILLVGGGFAIAKASHVSGFSTWLGQSLTVLGNIDDRLMVFLTCCIVSGITEVLSNTATVTLLLPVFEELALSTNIHPLYLMIPCGVACSFAFMLPVASPPNAIIFSTGHISISDMVVAGIPMNILGILVLFVAVVTWGNSMYQLDTIPDIFTNRTLWHAS